MPTPYERTLASFSRRAFLNAASKLGAAAMLGTPLCRTVLARPVFHAYPFSLGVASGDPLPDGVVLWTRLAPDPLDGGGMPMAAIEVEWQIASDEGMRQVVREGVALARPELGHSVHVEVDALQPAREYWYRFRVGNERSQVGRTKTAPAPGAPLDRLRFGTCGCSNYESGYFTASRHLAEERFDFVFHSGDYIYEYRADGGRYGKVRQHLGDEIYTVVDYRNRYAQYKSDPDLIAAHASAPFIVSLDDHEVSNNWAAEADERNTPPEVFLLRRAAAFQAYYEHMPLRRSAFPGGPALKLHRGFRFGDLVSLDALDTRQYRSPQACRRSHGASCKDVGGSTRTMLGREQESWLAARLDGSETHWKVLAQQVPIFGGGPGVEPTRNRHLLDQWPGYPAARERLLDTIVRCGLDNVVFLSGDVHMHWGASVPLNLAEPDGPAVAVEFTNTSISSGGDGSDEASWWQSVRTDCPHVGYHGARRGYVACEVTRESWQTDFMVVDRVETPDGMLARGGRVVVERGQKITHAA